MRRKSLFARGKLLVVLLVLASGLVAGRVALAQQPTVSLDFDITGPTITDDLPLFFDFLGFAPNILSNWTVDLNFVDPANGTNALHTTSEGERLEEFFSRVAILKADVFEAQDLSYSADITWDDNDNCGLYLRFNGESDVPLENDYYFARVDIDDGPPSSVYLYRVRDGLAELLIQATDDPFPVSRGETHTVTFAAQGDQLSVSLDGIAVTGMDPFVDPDPLLVCGRVGVGHNTNPSYYDNIMITNLDMQPCPCAVTRALSPRRYQPGGKVTVTLSARNFQGATTITETFPTGWMVTGNPNNGTISGNTIALNLNATGQVSYELTALAAVCQTVALSGTIMGAGNCAGNVEGDSELFCVQLPAGPILLDFDVMAPTTDDELPIYFDFLGHDPTVPGNWSIQENLLADPLNVSFALHTASNGNQLESWFSRVAIFALFEAENTQISGEISWDDNDWAGLYIRFTGLSNDPLGNDYYHVRGVANGVADGFVLDRVKGGFHEELIRAGPVVRQGDTHKVTIRAVTVANAVEIFVAVDDELVSGMDPYRDDFDPILGPGRVGVGQETNPTYFDNIEILPEADFQPFPCVVRRTLPTRYAPGDQVTVMLTASNLQGTTTFTETFPNGWMVTGNPNNGAVSGNTIAFSLNADGAVSYVLTPPAGVCDTVLFSGTKMGGGNCSGEVGGASRLVCVPTCPGALIFDFDSPQQEVAPGQVEPRPTVSDELPMFFDILGHDPSVEDVPNVGDPGNWSIRLNAVNFLDPSQALHTSSEGERLEEFFSRVAILKADVFEAQDLSYSADITWDDNDNCGLYLRFNGESDVPLENDYYFARVDIDDGPPSSVYLYRVRDGLAELLIQATDDPFPVSPGETHTVTFAAQGDQLSVSLDGIAVTGMDPFVDPDPLLVCGRVGVGHNTNPSYYDNIVICKQDAGPCPCIARRTLSTSLYVPGETVTVNLVARNIQGASTITETFPATWMVTNPGGGNVAGNTITFNLNVDRDVMYELKVPDGFCGPVQFSGAIMGGAGCPRTDVIGDSQLACIEIPAGAEILDFDNKGPLAEVELPDWFDFYGVDPTVGANWTIAPNGVNPLDPSNALRTTSNGERLEEFFSRVAILRADVFQAENLSYSADITWDDNDNCGLYLRFNEGLNPDDPLGNDYYFVRVDVDDGPPSSVYLYRVRDGLAELLIQATDDPFPVSRNATHTVTFAAQGDKISVSLDGIPVAGMDPFVDPDPLLGPGRVGVGQNTNPAYYDNFVLVNLDGKPEDKFVRGDSDSNGKIELTDGIVTLTFLFVDSNTRPACFDAADTDDDGKLSITDGIRTFQWLFVDPTQIPSPPSPRPGLAVYEQQDCGPDPNAEDPDLGCETLFMICR